MCIKYYYSHFTKGHRVTEKSGNSPKITLLISGRLAAGSMLSSAICRPLQPGFERKTISQEPKYQHESKTWKHYEKFHKTKAVVLWEFRRGKTAWVRPVTRLVEVVGEASFPGGWRVSDYIQHSRMQWGSTVFVTKLTWVQFPIPKRSYGTSGKEPQFSHLQNINDSTYPTGFIFRWKDGGWEGGWDTGE